MPRHFMQAFLRKLRRRNEQWVHSTHPLREQDRRWDSLGGDEVGNRPVRCKTGLYALSSLSYSVSSNETARNPFAAILSRARSPLLLFLSRRVLIFRTRTEKRGVGGKLFSLGTRRLSRRIFLLSKGITINFSPALIAFFIFFFFLIRNGKYLDDLGLYQAFNLTNMIIYVTLFLCKKIRDSRVFKFLDSSKHASLELKIVINLRGRIFNQRYLVI